MSLSLTPVLDCLSLTEPSTQRAFKLEDPFHPGDLPHTLFVPRRCHLWMFAASSYLPFCSTDMPTPSDVDVGHFALSTLLDFVVVLECERAARTLCKVGSQSTGTGLLLSPFRQSLPHDPRPPNQSTSRLRIPDAVPSSTRSSITFAGLSVSATSTAVIHVSHFVHGHINCLRGKGVSPISNELASIGASLTCGNCASTKSSMCATSLA